MKNASSYVALGIGLLTNTSLALAQTPDSIFVAQITGSVPSSGVLATPPLAPVAVPPSGILAATEPRFDTTAQSATGQEPFTRKRSMPVTTSRHVVRHRRLTERRPATRAAILDQNPANTPTPSLVGTAAEPPRAGQDVFFSNLGKGKAAR
jgi:hypothetical protein